jgi:hypothetical protein
MHSQTVTSKHFNSSNPLPFGQRRFREQLARSTEIEPAASLIRFTAPTSLSSAEHGLGRKASRSCVTSRLRSSADFLGNRLPKMGTGRLKMKDGACR